MANTYTQVHIQVIIAVRNRHALIGDFKSELYQYITGIVQNHNHKMILINGMPDHIHILIGMRPAQSLSELVKYIKQSSSKWINENRFTGQKFAWQEGFGAFSYSKSQLPRVIRYIENQEKHHHKRTFREEYLEILNAHQIDFDERYVFKPFI